ncbi:hypothetical protein ACP70R_013553 [Stipagrostis hirtigluma subsp. patula]
MAAEQQPLVKPGSGGGGGSRFAVTCGLLRQYMKEQGGNGGRLLAPAVAMSLVPSADVVVPVAAKEAPEEETKTVLELFPQQAGTLAKDAQQRKEPERAPLTIFYGGRMVVFDDFPAEKAEELMQLAGSCNVDTAASGAGAATGGQNALGHPPSSPDMPIARKASLQRFLEKRKSRLTAGDPYPAPSSPAAASESSSKPAKDGGAPWLGVNPMLTLS